MKGIIHMQVLIRMDKGHPRHLDRLKMVSIIRADGRRYFLIKSVRLNAGNNLISRDELAFIRLIYKLYSQGDYCIQFWGKGKNRGIRVFWDGIISSEKKFFRRRKAFGTYNIMAKPSFLSRPEEMSKIFIGNYMHTRPPGKWHAF